MNPVLQIIRNLGPARILAAGTVALALMGFLAFIGMRATQPPMALLFGNLDLRESSQIVSRLEAMKVPYRLGGGGAQVMVPEDQVARVRLAMAESGLPTGGSVGYEIFDKGEALGSTAFVQNINHARALEGELARTIRAIDGVQAARVHLVLPKREVFSREMREPSASIVLRLRGRLDPGQVRAVRNLVAAAVPDLKPSRISIVDDRGNLLASGAEEADPRSGASSYADFRSNYEERIRRSVETLMERTLGPGNVRAEVTADIDMDRVTTNSETFDPDGQVIRSTQSTTEQSNSNEGSQPVSVSANLPSANASQQGGSSTQSNTARTEEVVNYEVSKTVRTQVKEIGTVRRLSVAVAINGAWTTDAEGKRTYAPRSEDEMRQLTALVRSAVGYDEKRGDRLEVVQLRFAEPDDAFGAAAPAEGMFDFKPSDLLRLAESALIALLGLVALLLVGRPLLKRLSANGGGPGLPALQAMAAPGAVQGPGQPALPAAQGGAVAAALPGPDQAALPAPGQRNNIEEMIDVARIEGQVKASSMRKIGEIVEQHPEAAVSIVRNWLLQPA